LAKGVESVGGSIKIFACVLSTSPRPKRNITLVDGHVHHLAGGDFHHLNCRIGFGYLNKIDYGGPSALNICKDLMRLNPILNRFLRKDLGFLHNCMSKIWLSNGMLQR
jgi:hypothetical protein